MGVDRPEDGDGEEGHGGEQFDGHFEEVEEDKGIEPSSREDLLLGDAVQLWQPSEEGVGQLRELDARFEAALASRVEFGPSWTQYLESRMSVRAVTAVEGEETVGGHTQKAKNAVTPMASDRTSWTERSLSLEDGDT